MTASGVFKLCLGAVIGAFAGALIWHEVRPDQFDFDFEVTSRLGAADCQFDLDGERVNVRVPAEGSLSFFRLLMPRDVSWTCQTASGKVEGYEDTCNGGRIHAATIERIEDRAFC